MNAVRLDQSLLRSLLMLASVIEARDHYTAGHTWRVGQYARMLAEALGLSHDQTFLVHLGCLVHDIGKVSVPDAILNKPARLTDHEQLVVQQHPVIGYELIRDHPLARGIEEVVAQHHERYDGAGYPNGKAGDTIALAARIAAVADAFDAMTSSRPYRQGMAAAHAFQILEQGSGSQWDPFLTERFLALGRGGAFDSIMGHSSEGSPLLECVTCGPTLRAPRAAQDGDEVVCLSCMGRYVLHRMRDRFEVEWNGLLAPGKVAEPDTDMVEEFIERLPYQVRLAA